MNTTIGSRASVLECGSPLPLSIAERDRKLCTKLLADFRSGQGRLPSSEHAGLGERVCDLLERTCDCLRHRWNREFKAAYAEGERR